MDHSYSVFTMKIHESCVVTQCKISYIDGQVPKLKIFEQKDLKEKIFATGGRSSTCLCGIPYDRIADSLKRPDPKIKAKPFINYRIKSPA